MGFSLSDLNPLSWPGKIGDALGVTQKGPPGVSGPAPDPSRLVQQPDGTFRDPVTGGNYSDASGGTPVQNPNATNQVATQAAQGNALFGDTSLQGNRAGEAFAGQENLANSLGNTIRNPNAPSVAREQLNMSLGNIDRQQLAGSAGVGGNNAAVARRQSLQNMGNLGLQSAGQQALVRANEVQNAQGQLGNVYQNMAGNANTVRGQDITGSQTAEQNAAQNQLEIEKRAHDARTANQNMGIGAAKGIAQAGLALL